MNDQDQDIFGEVVETEAPKGDHGDPTKQLYTLPADTVEWFNAGRIFGKPKDKKDCTAHAFVRFVSWQITEANKAIYEGTGTALPGTLRNQMIVRAHSIPDGFDGDMTGRAPCMLQFGLSCKACSEKNKADKRFPRDAQPADYFKKVIGPLKPKDKTFMLGEVYTQDEHGNWTKAEKLYAFEFTNYLKSGRTFTTILNDRANDADKRIRIDKKTYAGYVAPVAINVTYSWPIKGDKPDGDRFASWQPTDAMPFPAEAGGPDVMKFTKEWAYSMAKLDPAAWINRNAHPKLEWSAVSAWLYDVFTGKVPAEPAADVDTADFGQLLEIIGKHPDKFADVDVSQFSYDMVEVLRPIVKGVLHG